LGIEGSVKRIWHYQGQVVTRWAVMLLPALLSTVMMSAIPGWATQSDWETVYETPNKNLVRAHITISGNSGTYTLYSVPPVQGKLTAITYHEAYVDERNPDQAVKAIHGTWQFGNSTGYFVFRKPDINGVMDGYWGYIDQFGRHFPIAGSWDGVLILKNPLENRTPEVVRAPPSFQMPLGSPNEDPTKTVDLSFLPQRNAPGNSNNVPAGWLTRGASFREAVGQVLSAKDQTREYKDATNRLVAENVATGQALGTCFFVAPGLAITAKHVFDGLSDPAVVDVGFPDASETNRFRICRLAAPPILIEPDIAIVRLNPPKGDKWPSTTIQLGDQQRRQTLQNGSPNFRDVFIIHFPAGQGQLLTLPPGTFNELMRLGDGGNLYLTYLVRTGFGSSGAPVFDADWKLIGIHSEYSEGRQLGRALHLGFVLKVVAKQLAGDNKNADILKALNL
jgi:S1-C subfamily serine protease